MTLRVGSRVEVRGKLGHITAVTVHLVTVQLDDSGAVLQCRPPEVKVLDSPYGSSFY